ncbi:MAG: hypothetical protein M2R45_03937 [Verrucomicrobia subdivision 3 bacterium]|nr:hypothetical protein [Limisphaerales bacterium]MCS1417696.1 hypothetical protein [Limisphaerales bacterium]
MARSNLFHTDLFVTAQKQIKDFLNGQDQFLSGSTAKSTRAVGDAIQDILSDNFQLILGDNLCARYSPQFARRAMADLAFEDSDGFYYVVDVKTHRLSTKFNMPNLTSVERLSRFYEGDKNYFVVLMVAYNVEDLCAVIKNMTFVPIEFLGWNCLTVGALGWGQIQIANSNRITINPQYSRKSWMIEFCTTMLEFYPKEITKINSRIERFKKIREEWEQHRD